MKIYNSENEIINTNEVSFLSIYDLFKIQVKKNPHAIAVLFGESSLTYEELDTRSSQLANFLRLNGVKSETVVALCLQNGFDLLVGILGILQSGGVYLPIDPVYPADRVESMLGDAKPLIVLTEEKLSSKFSFFQNQTILIDKLPPVESLSRSYPVRPNQLAYVVYTSGSSGQPKGILIEHRALAYAALVHQKLHSHRLVSLMSGSISFDASLLVISLTLISGGTICMPESEIIVDIEKIIALIEKHAINYTLCVPSFYLLILNKSEKLPSLQSISLGGETLPNSIVDLHTMMAPNSALYNVYGPSEYAIGATFAKIYDADKQNINKITIGKPFPNTHVYILNERLEQVHAGEKGEICIGGDGLARGYLNNEALSVEKFIWVSLHGQGSMRLYRTGDFGRVLPDGNIEFLGRIDNQVKIRGYRIELGEIEYAICQHPKVDEAVVLAREEMEGSKKLVGYFTSRTTEPIAEELHLQLQKTLPHYMIPSAFVQIDHWPRTPNGKIDRAALSNIGEQNSSTVFPRHMLSPLEQSLFEIWKKILGRVQFEGDANFFDLGGDSLQIVRIQTQIKEDLGLEVSLMDLFQYPTIFQLARHLSAENNEGSLSLKPQELKNQSKSSFQYFKKFTKMAQHESNG